MFREMASLSMHGDDDLRAHPFIHLHELRSAGVPGDVHMGLALRHDAHAKVGKLVHDPSDRDLVAGDDAR